MNASRGTPRLGLSQEGLNLLKSIEGLRLKPYDDQSGADIVHWVPGATIGYGHLIAKKEWPLYQHGVSEEQAEPILADDLEPFVNGVNSRVTVGLAQHQFDALVLLAFNIGLAAFSRSSVLKLVNDPEAATSYKSLEAAWKAWTRSQGKVNRGLINRREAEWNIYSQALYERW